MLDANDADHIRRKSGYAKAALALPGRWPWERGAMGVRDILTGGSRCYEKQSPDDGVAGVTLGT